MLCTLNHSTTDYSTGLTEHENVPNLVGFIVVGCRQIILRLSFIDFSLVFNTFIVQQWMKKLRLHEVDTCTNWILDVLTQWSWPWELAITHQTACWWAQTHSTAVSWASCCSCHLVDPWQGRCQWCTADYNSWTNLNHIWDPVLFGYTFLSLTVA